MLPPQGGFSYDGIRIDLTEADPVPLITDPGEDLGRPFFSERRIDSGDGQSPADPSRLYADPSCLVACHEAPMAGIRE